MENPNTTEKRRLYEQKTHEQRRAMMGLANQADSNASEVLEERLCLLLAELGVPDLPLKSAASLFKNNVNVGAAHYHDPGLVYHFEIGLKNDHNGCLDLLNAIVAPFPHGYSCGLARTVTLENQADVEAFYRRVGIALAAGNLAWELLHRQGSLKSTPS